jgi:hypothetical protein
MGAAAIIHHLLGGLVGGCVLVSAFGLGCWLVEGFYSSSVILTCFGAFSGPLSPLKGQSGFCLHVGVGILGAPQDGNCGRLLFGVGLFFGACFGVRYGFFSTCCTWLHADGAAVWMWKHVSTGLLP